MLGEVIHSLEFLDKTGATSLPHDRAKLYTTTIFLTWHRSSCKFWPHSANPSARGIVMTNVVLRVASLVLLLIAFAAGAIAQIFPGRVTGHVVDAQGAVIAGANVKLTNPATGLERSVTTDESGQFNFPELALGSYDLTVSKSGFQTTVLKDIRTSEGQVNTLAPVLKIGTVNTEVEVSSASPLIQTETNSAGGQLTEEQVKALPIGNSDFTRLALTLPGVVQNSNFAF